MYQITASLVRQHQIAQEAYEFIFDLGQSEFTFAAGQYISLTLPSLSSLAKKEQFRDFSISSAPSEALSKRQIKTITRPGISKFKKELFNLPLGSEVEIEGPKGIFTLPNKPDSNLIFVAGGIGITPMLSMIRHNHEAKLNHKIYLFYFNTSNHSAVYLDELSEPGQVFKFYSTIGKVTPQSIQTGEACQNPIWYISGPPGMVKSAQDAIIANVNPNAYRDMRLEEFSGYK